MRKVYLRIFMYLTVFLFTGLAVFGLTFSESQKKKEPSVFQSVSNPSDKMGLPNGDKFELQDSRSITTNKYYLFAPVWSPNGKRILATTEGYRGLFLIEIDGSKQIKVLNEEPGAGYGASWSRDGEKIYFQQISGNQSNARLPAARVVKSIQVNTESMELHADIIPTAIADFMSAEDAKDPVVFINQETLLIEGTTVDHSRNWVVTRESGPFYRPLLSPDKTKVLVHSGSTMYVYAIDGSGLLYSLGEGLAGGWSPDSKYVIYFIDKGDGHKVTGSELYITDITGSEKHQLTYTDAVDEMWPVWSPKNDQIAFADYRSGLIYIATLITK